MKFTFSRVPEIIFGPGENKKLPAVISRYGTNVLLITGRQSFLDTANWRSLTGELNSLKIRYTHEVVTGEPSPSRVDSIVGNARKAPDVVAAIGGGSVLDAGKAVAAMLPVREPVRDFLEDVGTRQHPGTKVPFIAVPTTAGTGSEASKNAVLSQVGTNGFKKSLRHDNFIPEVALVDPGLMVTCPPAITASSGLDAFTQLLESFVSTKANPVTDALAIEGMRCIGISLLEAVSTGAKDIRHRSNMAYGALLSGITLANAGLGVVHGLAGPAGGFSPVPHSVFCAALVAEATKMNISTLHRMGAAADPFLDKYAQVGILLSGKKNLPADPACCELIRILEEWTKKLKIPKLSMYGINEKIIDKIVKAGSNKNNPVELSKEEMRTLLVKKL